MILIPQHSAPAHNFVTFKIILFICDINEGAGEDGIHEKIQRV
jgi:hypothetical protein